MCVPFVQQAREEARRTQSRNNLKQIGLALHNYYDVYQKFPPGEVIAANGQAQHSWMSYIQPYMDASPLYNMLDFTLPWDHPRNVPVYRHALPWCLNSGVDVTFDSNGLGLTHYAGSSQVFGENSSVTRERLPLGSGNTVMAGEIAEGFLPWGGPGNWRDPSVALNSGPDSFGRYTGDGAFLLMADGSVRFMANAPGVVARKPKSSREVGGREEHRYSSDLRMLRPGLRSEVQIDSQGRVIAIWVPSGDKGTTPEPLKDGDFPLITELHDLEFLSAPNAHLYDSTLGSMGKFKNLQVLEAGGMFTDAGLKHLEGLTNLKFIELTVLSDGVTEAGITRLKAALSDCVIRVRFAKVE